ncbi:MAG TPA: CHRD domain-containing protein [Chitinophagaceae bacterium]|jgi:hypothetical protein|nr:CHRD domain-containing protein [Chitinophagaceae bacterium]
MKKFSFAHFLPLIVVFFLISCDKDEETTTPPPTIVKEWSIPLSAKNEVPAPASRNEAGAASLQLLSDNSLKYTINVTGLAAGDVLTAAHLHIGDVITSGGIVLGLNPVFTGPAASGTIVNLRSTLIDSLKSDANEIYLNVHSTGVPSGLVRGQLNTKLEMVADVPLIGANEVPAVNTTASGLALLRLTTDKKLYSKITVSNLDAGDALTAAHLHKAAAGANAGILLGIYGNAAEFGTTKIITVDDAMFTSIKTDAIYVNAHSVSRPAGLVRGQIR